MLATGLCIKARLAHVEFVVQLPILGNCATCLPSPLAQDVWSGLPKHMSTHICSWALHLPSQPDLSEFIIVYTGYRVVPSVPGEPDGVGCFRWRFVTAYRPSDADRVTPRIIAGEMEPPPEALRLIYLTDLRSEMPQGVSLVAVKDPGQGVWGFGRMMAALGRQPRATAPPEQQKLRRSSMRSFRVSPTTPQPQALADIEPTPAPNSRIARHSAGIPLSAHASWGSSFGLHST